MRNPFRREHKPARIPPPMPPKPVLRAYVASIKTHLTPDGLRVVEFAPAITDMLRLYNLRGSLGALYRSQPNVRSCVDFMATEVSGLKLKLYDRVPTSPKLPTGRLELDDHPEILMLNRPSPGMTRTRLWDDTVRDHQIYDIAYWQKFVQKGETVAVVRVPPPALLPRRDPVTHLITEYYTVNGTIIPVDNLIVFHGYDPENITSQVPPMETLRRVLAEEAAAGGFRENMWKRSARAGGIVERPADADEWTDEERDAWRTDWESFMTGEINSGATGLLEDGMTWKESTWTPHEAEYTNARKLNREECAAAFRIDPALVFASDRKADKETRTGFYVDRLVPYLTRLQEEVDVQLLPDFETEATARTMYHQFNIDEKLRGSFEEQSQIASSAVGGPFVTVNEMRARVNLPPIPGGDLIFIPLNSYRGGGPQASPQAPVVTPGPGPAPGETPGDGTEGQAAAARYFKLNAMTGELEPANWTPPPPEIHVHVVNNMPLPPVEEGHKSPPWHIEKRDDKYCVVKDETGESVGCHDTRADAQAQMDALYANVSYSDKAADEVITAAKLDGFRANFAHEHGSRLRLFFDRQKRSVKSKGGLGKIERWDRELADELAAMSIATTSFFGKIAAEDIGGAYDVERTTEYWKVGALPAAVTINAATQAALLAGTSVDDRFAALHQNAEAMALSRTNREMNWAIAETAKQNEVKKGTKTWVVTSDNPRESHAALDGETIPVDEPFSNGLQYPGDSSTGDAAEVSNCTCLVTYALGVS